MSTSSTFSYGANYGMLNQRLQSPADVSVTSDVMKYGIHHAKAQPLPSATQPIIGKSASPLQLGQTQWSFPIDRGDIIHNVRFEIVFPDLTYKTPSAINKQAVVKYAQFPHFAMFEKITLLVDDLVLFDYDPHALLILFETQYPDDVKREANKRNSINDSLCFINGALRNLTVPADPLVTHIGIPDIPLWTLGNAKMKLECTTKDIQDLIVIIPAGMDSTTTNTQNPKTTDIVDAKTLQKPQINAKMLYEVTSITGPEKAKYKDFPNLFMDLRILKRDNDYTIILNPKDRGNAIMYDFQPDTNLLDGIFVVIENNTVKGTGNGNETFNYTTFSPSNTLHMLEDSTTLPISRVALSSGSDNQDFYSADISNFNDVYGMNSCNLHIPITNGIYFLPISTNTDLSRYSTELTSTQIPRGDNLKLAVTFKDNVYDSSHVTAPVDVNGLPMYTFDLSGARKVNPQNFRIRSYHLGSYRIRIWNTPNSNQVKVDKVRNYEEHAAAYNEFVTKSKSFTR